MERIWRNFKNIKRIKQKNKKIFKDFKNNVITKEKGGKNERTKQLLWSIEQKSNKTN